MSEVSEEENPGCFFTGLCLVVTVIVGPLIYKLDSPWWVWLLFGLFILFFMGGFIGIMNQQAQRKPVKELEPSVENHATPYAGNYAEVDGEAIEVEQEEETWADEREWTYPVLSTGDNYHFEYHTTHGSAYFLSDTDKELKSGRGSGLWLGGGYFDRAEGHLLTIAQPGSGKGSSLIIPNLLLPHQFLHSAVVFDPKGTNAAITARYRRSMGHKVIILDPDNLQGEQAATHGIAPACFNPLDFLGDDLSAGCADLVQILLPDDPNGERFWNAQARDLLQAALLHVMTSPDFEGNRNLVALYDFIRDRTWEEALGDMRTNTEEGAEEVAKTARKFIQTKKESTATFGSIASATGEALDWMKYKGIRASLVRSDFDPTELDRGGTTIYLCLPFKRLKTYAVWSRLLVNTIISLNAKPKTYRKEWVHYFLDEFPTMGNFRSVIEGLAFTREYKMRLWLFSQTLSALDTVYSQSVRSEIVGNCRVFQAFSVDDPITTEYVSKRAGMKTEIFNSTSTQSGASETTRTPWDGSRGTSSGTSSSEQRISRPLIRPEEVPKNPAIITFVQGDIFRLRRWHYWAQPQDEDEQELHEMIFPKADSNRNYSANQTEQDDTDPETIYI